MKRLLPLFAAVSLFSGNLFAQSGGSFWLPPLESETAEVAAGVFYFIFFVAAFFFVLIVTVMIAFVIIYRRRPGIELKPSPNHNTPLEIAWTVIPLIVVIVIFYLGFTSYLNIRVAPRQAFEIHVKAKKWSWLFVYPNGHVDDELHVPVDEPVRLIMTSDDVIHSLNIPAFWVKMDVVPGRYTATWFRAKNPGEFDLLCAEYCGTGHSDMVTSVIVHQPGEFRPWLEKAGNWMKHMSPVDAGKELYRRRGCAQCHSADGTARVGPTLKGIVGQTHHFTDGTSAEVEANYIRESLLDPGAKVREGYSNQMPTYKGILSDDEITALIEYIKSLK